MSLYTEGHSFVDTSFVTRPRTTLRKATFHVLFNREENVPYVLEVVLKFPCSWTFAPSV